MSQVSSVSAFGNYLVNTREARLTGPRELLNELTKNTYLFAEMARGKDGGVAIQSGTEISDTVKISPFSNSRNYAPGDTRTTTRGATDKRIFVPWRFTETDRPYTEAEIDLNEGDEFTQFKNLEASLMTDLHTDHINFNEESLWRLPDATNMENRSAGVGLPQYSIPSIITESGGVAPTNTGAWTTIASINPLTEVNWRSRVSTYDSANPDDPNNGLFAAFDNLMPQLEFVVPGGFEKYMENDDLRAMKIVTNLDGLNLFQSLLRSGNDQTRAGPQDPAYGMPQFKGIPIKYISTLDTALLDETGATAWNATTAPAIGTYTNQAYPKGKPRFFFINAKYLKVVFHKKHMMRETDPISGGVQQRDTMSVFVESWWNLFPKSRKRHGMVRPI